ncbi:MAG: aminotransferase class III-fold pyridoxal phosphate-dependent enzyme, partial [Treponema sp.]|nr:aminotransferase class III-fold pyridoxal phosphate-dependent enzyme [Treponema sp.]
PAFLAEIARKGEKIISTIKAWKHPAVKEVRGRGLMTGVDIVGEAASTLEKALDAGLLLLSAGPNTLRFLPPYVISDAEIEQGLAILRGVL